MVVIFFLVQAATAPAQHLPDIELNADVRARSVTIEKKGDARLAVTTSPDGGNVVDVRAPEADGRRSLRNVKVSVRAKARIGEPAQAPQLSVGQTETSPQR